MYTKDAIRFALQIADQAVMNSLDTINDAPLTFPTERGGCHPLWVIGHLAFVEGLTFTLLGGGENPVAQWAELFGQDTVPTNEPGHYPPFEELRNQYAELRRRNLALFEVMSEADLDKTTPYQPTGLEEHFATFGKSLLTVALHQAMHRGHITDAYRAAGRVTSALPVAA